MSSSGILYSSPFSLHGLKVMITAAFSGTSINHCTSSKQSAIGSEVLLFEADKSNFFAFESNAVAYHVADASLRGVTDCERAKVKEFLTLAYADLDSITSAMIEQKNFGNFENVLKVLEERLTNYTYLAAERVTVADIAVFCSLLKLFLSQFDAGSRTKNYPCTNRWLQTILYHDNVSKILKETIKKPDIENFSSLIAVKKMFESASGKKTFSQGGKGKQQQQQPQQTAKLAKGKKAEPKAAAPAADAAAADDDEEPAPVKEAPSPFVALPAGKFDMNAFKRSYSNDDEKTSIAYFWSHFDPECYSIWFAEYKYAHELTKVFMTCNLVSGMFQRLDKMRAQSFGSMLIFGKDNNNSISGVWIWRGQDLAFKLSPDWQVDYELYEWKKLNPNSEKDKALVNQYLEWTGCDSKQRPFNQGKIFK